jgi:hypothetical protein
MADDWITQKFEQAVGRQIRDDEYTWIHQAAQADGSKRPGQDKLSSALDLLTSTLQGYSQRILAEAQARGIQGFDANAANELRDSIWKAGDRYVSDNFNDLFRANLDRIQIEQVKNPPVTEEQKADYGSDIERLVQSELGRAATPDEIDFYGKQMAQGESAFELAQFLRTTPEYQKIQSDKENARVTEESKGAREALDAELLKSEEDTFKRALPQIMSSFLNAGRINSSGINSAIARARGDLAKERQSFLANAAYDSSIRQGGYNREDFVNRNRSAFDQYLRQSEPAYQSRLGFDQFATARPFTTADDRLSRSRELDDYYRQQSDFNRYLDQQKNAQRQAGLYGLYGDALGGLLSGLGAYAGSRGQK